MPVQAPWVGGIPRSSFEVLAPPPALSPASVPHLLWSSDTDVWRKVSARRSAREIPEDVMDEAPFDVARGDWGSVPTSKSPCRSDLLDTVNVEALFRRRGCLMKNVPKFLVGTFRLVLRLALQEIQADLGIVRGVLFLQGNQERHGVR